MTKLSFCEVCGGLTPCAGGGFGSVRALSMKKLMSCPALDPRLCTPEQFGAGMSLMSHIELLTKKLKDELLELESKLDIIGSDKEVEKKSIEMRIHFIKYDLLPIQQISISQ